MNTILLIAQIVVSVILITLILLQQRGSGLGAAFGGGDSGQLYASRRGMEKYIFRATILMGAAFVVLALLGLIL